MDRISKQWWATEIGLLDGRRVLLRPMDRSDAPAFARLMHELLGREALPVELAGSAERDLAPFTDLDYVDHFAWVAQAIHDPGQPIVGVARYARDPDRPAEAEAATTVVDAWRGAGLGETLSRFLVLTAQENRVRLLRGAVQAGNQAALGLLTKLGGRAAARPDGACEVTLPLPRVTGEAERVA